MTPKIALAKRLARISNRSNTAAYAALQLFEMDIKSQLAINEHLERMRLASIPIVPIPAWLWLDCAEVSVGLARPS